MNSSEQTPNVQNNELRQPRSSARRLPRHILNIKPWPADEIQRIRKELEAGLVTEPHNKQNTSSEAIVNTNIPKFLPLVSTPNKVENFDTGTMENLFKTPDLQRFEKSANHSSNFNKYETPKSTLSTPRVVCSVDMKKYLSNRSLFTIPESPKTKIANNCVKQTLFSDAKYRKLRVKGEVYVVLRELGRGGSSEVLLGHHVITGQQRAIKCVSLKNPESSVGFIKEVEMLSKLQLCDRIIKLYDYEICEDFLYVVLEAGVKDLSKVLLELSQQSSHLPLHVLYYYWMEMLLCVKQLHSRKIIHSDLKPANFLMTENGIKLIDFGIAKYIPSDVTSVCKGIAEGSLNYISPEALTDVGGSSENSPSAKYKISYKSDVWSLGCILYQLVYGRTPFHNIKQMYLKVSAILNPKQTIQYPDQDWVPQKFVKTIKDCLQFNMKSRPSLDELIQEYERFLNDGS